MAREVKNVSGETVTVFSGSAWRKVNDGEIVVVDATDERDWPTADTGEASPVWEEVTKAAKATKKESE